MLKDPIVEEIHKIREKLMKKFNYNYDAINAYFKNKEKSHKDRLVSFKPKKLPKAATTQKH